VSIEEVPRQVGVVDRRVVLDEEELLFFPKDVRCCRNKVFLQNTHVLSSVHPWGGRHQAHRSLSGHTTPKSSCYVAASGVLNDVLLCITEKIYKHCFTGFTIKKQ